MDKKAYETPVIKTEVFKVGVFGSYSGFNNYSFTRWNWRRNHRSWWDRIWRWFMSW